VVLSQTWIYFLNMTNAISEIYRVSIHGTLCNSMTFHDKLNLLRILLLRQTRQLASRFVDFQHAIL